MTAGKGEAKNVCVMGDEGRGDAREKMWSEGAEAFPGI